jgi:hypothetical protein
VQVAAEKGEVRFSSHGKEVAVRQGTQSRAGQGEAPSDPERLPEDLFMSIIWPELQRQDANAQIRGRVSPSSRVKINGVHAVIAPDGSFSAVPALDVGTNRVEVQAEDLIGRKKNVARVINLDPQKPMLKATPGALWKR